MPLTYEYEGSKKHVKINTYMLTGAELLITLCYEIPCKTGSYKRRLRVLDNLKKKSICIILFFYYYSSLPIIRTGQKISLHLQIYILEDLKIWVETFIRQNLIHNRNIRVKGWTFSRRAGKKVGMMPLSPELCHLTLLILRGRSN